MTNAPETPRSFPGLAIGLHGGVAFGAGDNPSNVDREKHAAVARTLSDQAMRDLLATRNHSEITAEPFVAFPDDIKAIQDNVPALVLQVNNLADLPQDPGAGRGQLASSLKAANGLAPRLFAAGTRPTQLRDLLAGIRERASVDGMEMMQRAEMGRASFQRIVVVGDRADVAFSATTRRLTAAHGWIDEGRSQWQLELARESGQWLIVVNRSLALDGES